MGANEFGRYLRELRRVRGLTLRQIEKRSLLSYSYLSQIERGERGIPSPDNIRKLSQALGVTHIGLMIKAGHITLDEVLTVRKEHGIND